MHEPVRQGLEEYLRDPESALALPGFAAHLADCAECRDGVRQYREQSLLVRNLRAPEVPEARAGFYARVMERIEAQQPVPSFWSAFLEPAFGRRLVFSAATLLVLLGTYLYTTPMVDDFNPDPSAIMADDQQPPVDFGQDPEVDRSRVLVNLAGYQDNFQ